MSWFVGLGLSACLSSFQGSGLPYDLTSLVDLRRLVDFQLSSYFENENDDFQRPLYVRAETINPLLLFKYMNFLG